MRFPMEGMKIKKLMGIRKCSALTSIIIFCLSTLGCSATRLSITPESESMPRTFPGSCGQIIVKKMDAGPEQRKFNDALSGFVIALEKSGLADKVYYHLPPKNPVDLMLDLNFEKSEKGYPVGTIFKMLASSFSFGLLMPVFWYDYDYYLITEMEIYKKDQIAHTITAKANTHWSGKLMGLSEIPTEVTGLQESVYRQLLAGLNDYCMESEKGNQ